MGFIKSSNASLGKAKAVLFKAFTFSKCTKAWVDSKNSRKRKKGKVRASLIEPVDRWMD